MRYPTRLTGFACSFNGAMTFQPWILVVTCYSHLRSPLRFNGAMTFQPWIRHMSETTILLQWSHDLAMDT